MLILQNPTFPKGNIFIYKFTLIYFFEKRAQAVCEETCTHGF